MFDAEIVNILGTRLKTGNTLAKIINYRIVSQKIFAATGKRKEIMKYELSCCFRGESRGCGRMG